MAKTFYSISHLPKLSAALAHAWRCDVAICEKTQR